MQFCLVFSLCVHGVPSWGCCWSRKGVIRGDVKSVEFPEEQMELQYLLGKAVPGPSSPHPQGI